MEIVISFQLNSLRIISKDFFQSPFQAPFFTNNLWFFRLKKWLRNVVSSSVRYTVFVGFLIINDLLPCNHLPPPKDSRS